MSVCKPHRRVNIVTLAMRHPRHPRAPGTLASVDLQGLIDVRPGVRGGKPCFVGTRIAVYDVLEYLAGGMTHDEIVRDFPSSPRPTSEPRSEVAALRERRLLPLGEVPVRPELVAPPGRELAEWFPDSVNVGAVGLDVATDREIWDFWGIHDGLLF